MVKHPKVKTGSKYQLLQTLLQENIEVNQHAKYARTFCGKGQDKEIGSWQLALPFPLGNRLMGPGSTPLLLSQTSLSPEDWRN